MSDAESNDKGSETRSSHAPELDSSVLAPQHYPLIEGLQVPLVDGLQALHTAESSQQDIPTVTKSRLSKRLSIAIATMVCIFLVAIGLGVGLGFGSKHEAATSSSTPTAVNTASTTLTSNLGPPTQPFKNGILNDTSLAAVTTAEGNRHVFFQDLSGSLRHNVFDLGANMWLNNTDFVNSDSPPRNLTPIAAVAAEPDLGVQNGQLILIMFISTNGLISCTSFYVGSGSDSGPLLGLMNNSFPVAQSSRTLSLSQTPLLRTDDAIAKALLMYEAPNGNITTMVGLFSSTSGGNITQWTWQNISDTVYSSLSKSNDLESLWLSPPLGSSSVTITWSQSSQAPSQEVYVSFFNRAALSNATLPAGFTAQFLRWTDPAHQSVPAPADWFAFNNQSSTLRQSDVISYFTTDTTKDPQQESGGQAFVENGSLNFMGSMTPPNTPFPFSRLAWLNSTKNNAMYVYHQLSESIIVEDAYFNDAGWSGTEISVRTST